MNIMSTCTRPGSICLYLAVICALFAGTSIAREISISEKTLKFRKMSVAGKAKVITPRLMFPSPYGKVMRTKNESSGTWVHFQKDRALFVGSSPSLEAVFGISPDHRPQSSLRDLLGAKTDAEAFRKFIRLEKGTNLDMSAEQLRRFLDARSVLFPADSKSIIDFRRPAGQKQPHLDVFQVGKTGNSEVITVLIFGEAIHHLQFSGKTVTQAELEKLYAALEERPGI